MADSPATLSPATRDEIARALSFALRFDERKGFNRGNEFMANITAEHLIEHLERAGFVVMKRPPMPAHSTAGTPPAG